MESNRLNDVEYIKELEDTVISMQNRIESFIKGMDNELYHGTAITLSNFYSKNAGKLKRGENI